MITRRMITAAALTLTVVAAACGASNADDPGVRADGSVDLTKVTLHLGDQKGTGLQALLDSAGELRSTPYRIQWSQYTSGPPLLEAVNSGAVDFGQVGNAPPVFAAAAKSALKVVGAYRIGVAGQAIVVPKDSPLHTLEDLRGKKIAVAKGTSGHHQLLAALAKYRIPASDIHPQYLQPADALAALTTGRVDAWAIWDPYTAQVQQQNGARILLDGTGYIHGDSFSVASTTALSSKGRTAAVRDLLERIRRAHLWANEHQPQWAQSYARLTSLPYAVTLASVQRGPFQDHPLDLETITAEQQVADLFAEAKVIPRKVTIADFVDTRFDHTTAH